LQSSQNTRSDKYIVLARLPFCSVAAVGFPVLYQRLQKNDRRIDGIENIAIFHRVVPQLFVPNGVGAGFEIDHTT